MLHNRVRFCPVPRYRECRYEYPRSARLSVLATMGVWAKPERDDAYDPTVPKPRKKGSKGGKLTGRHAARRSPGKQQHLESSARSVREKSMVNSRPMADTLRGAARSVEQHSLEKDPKPLTNFGLWDPRAPATCWFADTAEFMDTESEQMKLELKQWVEGELEELNAKRQAERVSARPAQCALSPAGQTLRIGS